MEVAGSNPAGGAEGGDGTVRKPAKRPGSNPGILWVRLPPVLLEEGSLGWCSSRRPVKPLPSSGEAEGERFDSFATHWQFSMKVRSSIGTGHQPLKLGGRVRFPHGPLDDSPDGGMARRAGLRSTCPRGVGVRISPRRLIDRDGNFPGEAGARLAFMRSIRPARYRGLGLRVGRCSAEFHTLRGGGSTPRPATSCSRVARYANWHRGHDHPSGGARSLVPVGSTPTRATDRSSSRRLAAKTPVLHTG